MLICLVGMFGYLGFEAFTTASTLGCVPTATGESCTYFGHMTNYGQFVNWIADNIYHVKY